MVTGDMTSGFYVTSALRDVPYKRAVCGLCFHVDAASDPLKPKASLLWLRSGLRLLCDRLAALVPLRSRLRVALSRLVLGVLWILGSARRR